MTAGHSIGQTISGTRLALGFVVGTLLVAFLGLGVAGAYPGGTPDFQTDVGPYCAACHASTADSDLAGLGDRATAELPPNKHYALIQAGTGPYAALSEAERARLIGLVAAVDRNSTIAIEFPAQVAAGETFTVTVKVAGGAGPSVAVALVDRPHRFFARPASAVGWQVVGAPSVIGPKGPQTKWIERRPERQGRGITFVNIGGIESSADADQWSRAKVIFTLKAPSTPGNYPMVGAFFYGTETGTSLGARVDPQRGLQPLGGAAGRSGRIKFTAPGLITVKPAESIPAAPAAAVVPAAPVIEAAP